MLRIFFKSIDPVVVFCIQTHDFLYDFIAKNLSLIKRTLLGGAFLCLFFIFFPIVRKDLGNYAENILLGILFLSPLSKIFRMKLLMLFMGLRRELGILMGCLALVHGVGYFIDPAVFPIVIAPYLNADSFSMQPLFYFGILTLLFTVPLLLTSNNFSVRILGGKKWKGLHRLAYGILILVLVHIFFVHSANRGYEIGEVIQPLLIIMTYVFLKLLAWKNFLPFMRDTIMYTSERYATYRNNSKKSDDSDYLTSP
jgi:sulfoxide reductase heme-binding subunit YedZ